MYIKKNNIIKIVSLLVIFLVINFLIGNFNDKAQSTYTSAQYIKPLIEIETLNMELSSDDIKSLEFERNTSNWREVKIYKELYSEKVKIRTGTNEFESYQIKMDNDVYSIYKLNKETLEKYIFLQTSKLKGLEGTDTEFIRLYFNEVDMGIFIKENIIIEKIKDLDENYYIKLNSDTHYIRKLNYDIDNKFENVIEYFNVDKLTDYISLYELFRTDYEVSLYNIFYKYDNSTNQLTPIITINASPSISKSIDLDTDKTNELVEILEKNYDYLKLLNSKRIKNIENNLIINEIKSIYDTLKYFYPDINKKNNNELESYFEENITEIHNKIKIFNEIDPYKKSMRLKFSLNGKWQYLTTSHKGGFYEEEFDLTFETNENSKVYYTLDGSEPSNKDYLYSQPITIRSRKGEDNILSNIKDISLEWKQPKGQFIKGTVLRSIVYYQDKPVSKIMTNTYFVDENIKERFDLPVISLVTNKENLFGYEEGIYVLGKERDNWLKRNSIKNLNRGSSANYTMRGKEWERPISMEWFESDGELQFSQNLGIRINGGWSRSYPLKPLKVYARSEYDSDSYIEYEVFPDLKQSIDTNKTITKYDTLLLRNSGHDFLKTMFKDAMIQSLMEDTKLDIQAYRPSVVFINGEYWGIYNIRERQDEDYISNHYDILKDDVVILENHYTVKSGNNNDKQHFIDMVNYIKNNDITSQKIYNYIKTQMDIENFIDYCIIQTYIANGDWPFNNVKYWRRRIEKYDENSLYGQDGKWRWLLFDTDSGFQFTYRKSMSYATGGDEDWVSVLLKNLLENNEFKNEFIKRFADLLNTNLKEEFVIKRIEDMKSNIENEMKYHIDRWRTGGDSIDSWNEYVDDLKEFAQKRPYYVKKDIVNFFNLNGTIEGNLELCDNNSGSIIINRTLIDNTDIFKGTYFKNIPITISALPNEGYVFTGFEGDVTSTLNNITFKPDNNFYIKANFKKIQNNIIDIK